MKTLVFFGHDFEKALECGSFTAAVTRAHVLASVTSIASRGPVAVVSKKDKFVIDYLPSLRGSVRILSRVSA